MSSIVMAPRRAIIYDIVIKTNDGKMVRIPINIFEDLSTTWAGETMVIFDPNLEKAMLEAGLVNKTSRGGVYQTETFGALYKSYDSGELEIMPVDELHEQVKVAESVQLEELLTKVRHCYERDSKLGCVSAETAHAMYAVSIPNK